MADPKNPLAYFRRYFNVRQAVTEADRNETFRVRYRVYCEEFGYEPADRFPDKMEHDAIDPISTHCLITHVASRRPAGCVRICPASVDGVPAQLPFDQCCKSSLDPAAMETYVGGVPRDRICEASRFAVDGAFRRRSGESLTRFGEIASLDLSDTERRTFPLISVALVLTAAAMADLIGRPYSFSVMEPFLPRLLRRSGMVFHRMGKDLDHHGIRAVYFTDARDFVHQMDDELRQFYTAIHRELELGMAGRGP